MLNAWVLSLIVCSATPLADGSYCETRAVDYALSREQCKVALAAEKPRLRASMRLECTEDPALSAALEEMDGPGDGAPPLSRADIRRER
ncbi:MAG: hypothetical protein KF723_23750 [Rhizobiaceae bacterium]|nr:hypothetical protein [Alphaproteobacteria bacterium]MBX3580228.1 hypothetical protein [Rhizobiaceae bacterium]MCW5740687.1 hypothetical protein [Alphaproteobacteria bacterium]